MSNPDGTATDPEALGDEREQYPDPESYPPPETPEEEATPTETPGEETSDGSVPDPDITGADTDGQT
jgi:hypothetical protein